jgi:hypothetical protein
MTISIRHPVLDASSSSNAPKNFGAARPRHTAIRRNGRRLPCQSWADSTINMFELEFPTRTAAEKHPKNRNF